jgi:hypothetical protein
MAESKFDKKQPKGECRFSRQQYEMQAANIEQGMSNDEEQNVESSVESRVPNSLPGSTGTRDFGLCPVGCSGDSVCSIIYGGRACGQVRR